MRHNILLGVVGVTLVATLTLGGLTGSAALASARAVQEPVAQQVETEPGEGATMRARRVAAATLILATAEVTGIERRTVVEQLRAGTSLQQIAEASGASAQEVIDTARGKIDTRLDQAVTSGKITQERADTALQRFDQAAPQLVGDAGLWRTLARGRAGRNALGAVALVQATAEASGLTASEVAVELRAGKSLRQIAEASGASAEDILSELRERGEQRLNQGLDRARELIERPFTHSRAPASQPAD